MGISIEHNTNNTYENGDQCVRIWKRREVHIHVFVLVLTLFILRHRIICWPGPLPKDSQELHQERLYAQRECVTAAFTTRMHTKYRETFAELFLPISWWKTAGSTTTCRLKPRPTHPQEVPVQLPRPSMGQYVLGPRVFIRSHTFYF